MTTVYCLDSTGTPVSSAVKTAVQTYLQSLREINFVVNMDDPTKSEVNVVVAVTMAVGYTAADIISRVTTAIINFLNPATWGISPSDNPANPITWINTPVINRLELASAITTVVGVNVITSLTLGLHSGSQAATDLALPGKAPVPFTVAADITVTAS
jgi:energy-converting hydrogenase Eha subunit A